MSTGDRIADVLAGLQQSSINRRTRDLAFLGDLQDFAKTKTASQRDNALMGARTLTPLEEGKSFDVDAILAGNAARPGEERIEMARELQMPKMSEEELKEIANGESDEEIERQARIQAIKDSNAALIAKRSENFDPGRSDRLLQEALDEGRITFSGKTLDDVLTDLDRSTTTISDEDMASRIVAKKETNNDRFAQFKAGFLNLN
jgi:hypothetical protein